MGMKTPLICEIAPKTYCINEFGLAAMFLLEGDEKALLIDTGCGVCDLKAVAEGLTDKPITVVLTHGHMDHVGGMGFFDEVYIHEADMAMAAECSAESIRAYAESFGKGGSYEIYDYDVSLIVDRACPKMIPIRDQDVFELGGREILAINIPGHTPGGISFLDRKNRIMFSGDCCNFNLLALGCSVEETLEGLRKFKTYEKEYDQNFNGHVGFMNMPNVASQAASVPDDLIEICKKVLNGEAEQIPYEFLGTKLYMTKYGSARLSYDPENIHCKA